MNRTSTMGRALVFSVLWACLFSCQDGGAPSSATPPSTSSTTTTTIAPSADDLTGHWVGEAPDGTEMSNAYGCRGRHDLYLDIVHSGTQLSGDVVMVVRENLGAPCFQPGDRFTGTLTGTAQSGNVTMRWDLFWSNGSPVSTWQRLEGTATATEMRGRLTEPEARPPYRLDGTWVIRR